MNQGTHNQKAIQVCKSTIKYISNRQKILKRENLNLECKSITEEFKEWLENGHPKENIIYLIDFKD